MSALGMADALAGAATATAGLVLVFLGAISTSLDSYEAKEKRAAFKRFRGRSLLSFAGLILAISSAVLALIAKWGSQSPLAVASFVCLAAALACVVIIAYLSVAEMT